MTIPANNYVFNNELKCIATWTGDNGKAINTKTDINAIGASMAEESFSDGSTGDGVMTCLVWGDSVPFSVTWKDADDKVINDVANKVIIKLYTNLK